ncbi:hypothetical protein [Pseudanabaena sp. PCC 6802]|uniref:hypothetical protein n=1 Tax=Pseudanabaena sp. PCC 6802 TaxID=118173 RepID=UPI000346EBCB|nr:hypothetical protein [Pseudanabaena sp. PCC 6802]
MTFEFSKNSKQVGCRPRSAILRREYVGGAAAADSCIDTSGSRNKYVIVLTSAHYDSLQIGTAVSVNGINYTVAGKRREEMR